MADAAGEPECTATEELSNEQIAELDRRAARRAADPGATVPWEQIEKELTERFGPET